MKSIHFIFIMIVSILLTFSIAFAAVDFQNVAITGDILSWDPITPDNGYVYDVKLRIEGKGSVTAHTGGTSVDLSSLAERFEVNSATCEITLSCQTEGVANPWQGTYNYVSSNPMPTLDTPTNITWNGKVVSWTPVEHAETYQFVIFKDYEDDVTPTNDTTNTNQIDFSSDSNIEAGYVYSIRIRAKATGYQSSEWSFYISAFVADNSQTAIPDVSLSGNTLSWGHFSRSNYFRIELGGGRVSIPNGYTYDLEALAQNLALANDTYTVKLYATTSDYATTVSDVWEGTYTYTTGKDKLDAPTNLRWDGKIARWDSVDNAETYNLWLFIYPNTSSSASFTDLTTNYYDFANYDGFDDDEIYYFIVEARSPDYPKSDYSEPSPNYSGGTVLGNLQNVQILEDGTITWDAYIGADDYYYDINGNTGYTNGATSINIFDFVSHTDATVNVSLAAVQVVGGYHANITNTWTRIINIIQKGDIDKSGEITIVDVRLLLQTILDAGQNPSWDDEDYYYMDINGNDTIDIIDVRLLLQMCIV